MCKKPVWHSFERYVGANIHTYEENHCAEHPDHPGILCSDDDALIIGRQILKKFAG